MQGGKAGRAGQREAVGAGPPARNEPESVAIPCKMKWPGKTVYPATAFLAAAAADSGLLGGSAPQSRRAVAAAGISPPTVNCQGIFHKIIGNSCKSTKGNQVGAAPTCQCRMLPDVPDGGTARGHIAEGGARRTDGEMEKQGFLADLLRAAHVYV